MPFTPATLIPKRQARSARRPGLGPLTRRLGAGLVATLATTTVAMAAVVTAVAPAASAAPAHGLAARSAHLGRSADPSTSANPGAGFGAVCLTRGHAAACNVVALTDINAARHREHLTPMVLPAAYGSWTTVNQLRWVTNSERTARGLPALQGLATMDRLATLGAIQGQDPTGPANTTWGSNIAWGYATALAADFGWMYDDGPASPNVDCTSAGAAGCWGHRHNILAPFAGYQGEGVSTHQGVLAMTELFVAR